MSDADAKPDPKCKECYGRGKIIRTAPIPDPDHKFTKKRMARAKVDCYCVRKERICRKEKTQEKALSRNDETLGGIIDSMPKGEEEIQPLLPSQQKIAKGKRTKGKRNEN